MSAQVSVSQKIVPRAQKLRYDSRVRSRSSESSWYLLRGVRNEMDRLISLEKRKFVIFRSLSRLTLAFYFVLGSYIAFSSGKLSPLQAQYTPTAATGNPWHFASFPVENFQAYTSGYGYRASPVSGQPQFHRGLDMAAPIGSYVRNWWTGRVVSLSDHTACGTMIQVQSGDWTHIYCHLVGSVQKQGNSLYLIDREGGIFLQQGQDIPAGARIGRVGMTGRTTGPHLHWGLKYGGEYVDPALVLREMFNQQASR